MTTTPEQKPETLKKGQTLFMTGLGLVMGGCVFGGGLAVVFHFLSLRPAAIVAGLLAAVAVLIGVWLQVSGARLLRNNQESKRS